MCSKWDECQEYLVASAIWTGPITHFWYQRVISGIFTQCFGPEHDLTMSSNDSHFCCISRTILKSKSTVVNSAVPGHKHLNLVNVLGMVSSKVFPLSKQSQHDSWLWSTKEPFMWKFLHSSLYQSWICSHYYGRCTIKTFWTVTILVSLWLCRRDSDSPSMAASKRLSQGAVTVYNRNIPTITNLPLDLASPFSIPHPTLAAVEVLLKIKAFLASKELLLQKFSTVCLWWLHSA